MIVRADTRHGNCNNSNIAHMFQVEEMDTEAIIIVVVVDGFSSHISEGEPIDFTAYCMHSMYLMD